VTEFVEMFRHWNAGRSQVQISEALGIDRKTIRKYVAPALAEGLQPSPESFDEEVWRARIRRWFPALVDPVARAVSWAQIAVHHQWIADQLKVPVTVATIAQRLHDDHHVEVSESTVRRYIAITFTEQRLQERVTVPRGAVAAGSEAQIDYGRLGMWSDPVSGRRGRGVGVRDDPVVFAGAVRPTGAADGPNVLERLACGGVRVLRRRPGAAGVRQPQNRSDPP
jgi:hypothetical protein